MNEPDEEAYRLRVSERLKTLTQYEKFANPETRLLVLQSRYWLDEACRRAAERMGWTVQCVSVPLEGHLERENLRALLEGIGTFRPDFALTINFSGMDRHGLLARLFEDLEIPLAAWFVDNPRTILPAGTRFGNSFAAAFTWERAYIPYLETQAFALVKHLPLAVDDQLFHNTPLPNPDIAPSFVGSSMAPHAAHEGQWLRRHAPGLFDALEQALDEDRVTRQRFSGGLENILPADALSGLDVDMRRHAELYLFVEGTRRVRERLARVLKDRSVTFCGDEGWEGLGVRTQAPVDYDRELADWYRRSAVNINSTSLQMPTAVNQRVFDCPAAGGFVLTDQQSDLEKFFDLEQEIVTYNTFDECAELTDWYARNPDERLPYIRNAQKRIEAEHTYRHRLETMVKALKKRYGEED